jgi:hypothetical protein
MISNITERLRWKCVGKKKIKKKEKEKEKEKRGVKGVSPLIFNHNV